MAIVRSLTLAVFSLVLAVSASRAEEVKGDLAGLQGTWSAAAGAKKKVVVTMEIRGRTVSVEIRPPVGAPIRATGAIRLDPKATPKALDWVGFAGLDGQAFPEILGIYELKGDTFRVCNGGPDNPRPAEFAPGEGMLADVLTFTRRPTAPPDGRHGGE